MVEYTSNGIKYNWELSGPNGAAFTLFPNNNTIEQIAAAKRELRNDNDVVRLSIADDNDLDYMFKSDYFRHPATRSLKWWQIEQDEKLIRKQRKAGLTPDQFVERFVLPFTKEVEARNLAQFGISMYDF